FSGRWPVVGGDRLHFRATVAPLGRPQCKARPQRPVLATGWSGFLAARSAWDPTGITRKKGPRMRSRLTGSGSTRRRSRTATFSNLSTRPAAAFRSLTATPAFASGPQGLLQEQGRL